MIDLRFPIGEFVFPTAITEVQIKNSIQTIDQFSKEVEQLVSPLTKEQLNWKYRPNGWNIQQVIHHCADSHMNSFIRFKLALTEDKPVVKPYFEDRWAELIDADIESSLLLLNGLHTRWVVLLNALSGEQLTRVFIHPEHGLEISIEQNICFYGWHCKHHLAHIKQALEYKGEFEL